ncbi:hypothetical protein H206_05508 [Candidatus Electrothrix aarhusensis]|uniref:Uncharacterized protein n=1 Tax=Candidatus Electrothrix aarhusensis TaxID=1859131 RepID=A0A3S3QHX3_9BACT|nr:hypothetical protein H206_05508 [Candidatus Electrothrix aarhusensis]
MKSVRYEKRPMVILPLGILGFTLRSVRCLAGG